MMDLGTLGGYFSYAFDINNQGQIVGHSTLTIGGTYYHAFRYSNGRMTDLGALEGGYSYAYAINEHGVAVGAAFTWGGGYHAVQYSDGRITDLGTLGGPQSSAFGINDDGIVVGRAQTGARGGYAERAFLFANGTMRDLGTLGGSTSEAYGINNRGQVVGRAQSPIGTHGFMYSHGTMKDLNDLIGPGSGWLLYEAAGINDTGQIVGYGRNPLGQGRAFLLTPLNFTVDCATPATNECGAASELVASVTHSAGYALTAVWHLNGTSVHTNLVPAGSGPTRTNVAYSAELSRGTHAIAIVVEDSQGNSASCSTTVRVVDRVPPLIASASATPNVLLRPNHRMQSVLVRATVAETCDTASWRIIAVTSNEPINGTSDGDTAPDWIITGEDSVDLRAERSAKGEGRIYSIVIQATEASGNASPTKTLTVSVPR
jgi:probable HAF family extracellular repeat protein